MKLVKALDLQKNTILSIVGAGGKTSLMFNIAEELKGEFKVLATTTTKIFLPKKEQYDYLYLLKKNCFDSNFISRKGIYVFGDYISEDGKIIGLDNNTIKIISHHFHYTIIEADGSKMKPIKGWNDKEPVICDSTNKTVGVIDIQAIGKKINSTNIHRLDEFLKLTNSMTDESIKIGHLVSLILRPEGLFKNALGEKILFINKVESEYDIHLANNLLELVFNKSSNFLNKAIMGSLKNKSYKALF